MSRKPRPQAGTEKAEEPSNGEHALYRRRHLSFGWWSLLFFLTLGIALEAMHGFKVGWYLNVSNQTRRLLWTLAHAHGTLLALVHVAFGLTVPHLSGWSGPARAWASASLMGASVALPAGFFLGGIVIYAGDPGLGILLVPLGALMLFVAVFLTARGTRAAAGGRRKPD